MHVCHFYEYQGLSVQSTLVYPRGGLTWGSHHPVRFNGGVGIGAELRVGIGAELWVGASCWHWGGASCGHWVELHVGIGWSFERALGGALSGALSGHWVELRVGIGAELLVGIGVEVGCTRLQWIEIQTSSAIICSTYFTTYKTTYLTTYQRRFQTLLMNHHQWVNVLCFQVDVLDFSWIRGSKLFYDLLTFTPLPLFLHLAQERSVWKIQEQDDIPEKQWYASVQVYVCECI